MKAIISKSVLIHAPKEKIWAVLIEEKYTKKWYDSFSEGTVAQTDWKEGSRVIFTDGKGMGLLGVIVRNQPYDLLSIQYLGEFVNGKEDFESDSAKEMKGLFETYTLTTENTQTRLDITVEIPETYYKLMDTAWDIAVQKIQELSESTEIN